MANESDVTLEVARSIVTLYGANDGEIRRFEDGDTIFVCYSTNPPDAFNSDSTNSLEGIKSVLTRAGGGIIVTVRWKDRKLNVHKVEAKGYKPPASFACLERGKLVNLPITKDVRYDDGDHFLVPVTKQADDTLEQLRPVLDCYSPDQAVNIIELLSRPLLGLRLEALELDLSRVKGVLGLPPKNNVRAPGSWKIADLSKKWLIVPAILLVVVAAYYLWFGSGTDLSVASVEPSPVKIQEGTPTITIRGTDFHKGASVEFKRADGKESLIYRGKDIVFDSGEMLESWFSTGLNAAEWTVEVANPDGSKSAPFHFRTVLPPPVIDSAAIVEEGVAKIRGKYFSQDLEEVVFESPDRSWLVRKRNTDFKVEDEGNQIVVSSLPIKEKDWTVIVIAKQGSSKKVNVSIQTGGGRSATATPAPSVQPRGAGTTGGGGKASETNRGVSDSPNTLPQGNSGQPKVNSVFPPVLKVERVAQKLEIEGSNFTMPFIVYLRDGAGGKKIPVKELPKNSSASHLEVRIPRVDSEGAWYLIVQNSDKRQVKYPVPIRSSK